MSVRYNDDFKKEVVRAYMAGNKSTVELSAEYNVAKSTILDWTKKYGEEYQYTNTTHKNPESDMQNTMQTKSPAKTSLSKYFMVRSVSLPFCLVYLNLSTKNSLNTCHIISALPIGFSHNTKASFRPFK